MILSLLGVWWLVASCASSSPPSQLGSYLGDAPEQRRSLPRGPVEAGLLVVGEVPPGRTGTVPLPQSLRMLTHEAVKQLQQTLPLQIVKVLPADEVDPTGDRRSVTEKAKAEGLSHVVLVLFSHAVSVVPRDLPVIAAPEQGGSGARAPGLETHDYALAEVALLDVETGEVLLRADGRAWAEMLDLYAGIRGNYPVIHRSLRIPPIYPRRGQDPHAVLQYVAGQEALEQAVSDLEKHWFSAAALG